jgi:5,10-methylenetetrahydrofolate reductase
MPIKSKSSGEALSKIPGIKVPETFLASLQGLSDQQVSERSIQLSLEIAGAVKNLVVGFHVISGATPLLALSLVSALAPLCRSLRTGDKFS